MDMAKIGLGRVGRAWALGAAVLGGTASTAWSQQVMVMESSVGGFRGAGSANRVTSRSVAAYGRLLGLGEMQVEIARGLLEQYTANMEDAARKRRSRLQALMEEVRQTEDHSIMMEHMPGISEDFAERSKAIEASFFSDLRLLLDDQQAPRWERVERLRRRETVLRQGALSGETVDLIAIADSVGDGLDLGDEVRAALEQYEIELDRALIAKAATLETMRSGTGAIMGLDLSEMEEMSAKAREVGLRVRDLNRRHARLIGSMLPEDLATRFDDETRRRSFPRVYRESRVDRMLLAAESLDDLDPDQRQSLGEIHRSYTRDRASSDEKWVAAIREQEEEGGSGWAVGQLMIRYSMMGEESDNPVSKAREARDKVDERYGDKIQAALTPDQRERLPKPDDPQSGAGRRIQTDHGMFIRLAPGGGG